MKREIIGLSTCTKQELIESIEENFPNTFSNVFITIQEKDKDILTFWDSTDLIGFMGAIFGELVKIAIRNMGINEKDLLRVLHENARAD